MFAMPSNVAPQSSLPLQNACAPGKFAEIFDRGSRICDPVDPNEDAVDAAEKVAWVFGEREGWTGFCNDLTNRGEVYGFGVKQLLDDLSVLIEISHVISPDFSRVDICVEGRVGFKTRPRLSNGARRADFVA